MAAEALVGLLLDVADTAVTRETAQALARVGTKAAIRLIALAAAGAEDSHPEWIQTGVHDALVGSDTVPDVAVICQQLVRDRDAAVRRGAAEVLTWTDDTPR